MSNTTYTLGDIFSPYSQSEFETMLANHEWTEAWVRIDGSQLELKNQAGVTVNSIGFVETPYSIDTYNRLVETNNWFGGFVLMDNVSQYVPGSDEPIEVPGSGSDGSLGCGDTEGCGCGSGDEGGSGSGTMCMMGGNSPIELKYPRYRIYPSGSVRGIISWPYGCFLRGSDPVCTLELDSPIPDGLEIDAYWAEPYILHIDIKSDNPFGKEENVFIIPEIYRE